MAWAAISVSRLNVNRRFQLQLFSPMPREDLRPTTLSLSRHTPTFQIEHQLENRGIINVNFIEILLENGKTKLTVNVH